MICRSGLHDLIEILSKPSSIVDGYIVVRWCERCGAVVVDEDVDGHTAPGAVMKMRLPTPYGVTESHGDTNSGHTPMTDGGSDER